MAQRSSTARKIVGLGFTPTEARHGFLIDVPKGSAHDDRISITEHRGDDLNQLCEPSVDPPSPGKSGLHLKIAHPNRSTTAISTISSP